MFFLLSQYAYTHFAQLRPVCALCALAIQRNEIHTFQSFDHHSLNYSIELEVDYNLRVINEKLCLYVATMLYATLPLFVLFCGLPNIKSHKIERTLVTKCKFMQREY